MVAPAQHDFLKSIMNSDEVNNIFDPFFGSGTSLYEAMLLDETITLYGRDINPLAYLITETKLKGIDKENINVDIAILKNHMSKSEPGKHSFKNIDKWFRKDIIDELRIIRRSIMKIENEKNRKFFWYSLCNVIRKYSNTRSSTYKLHIKNKKQIESIKNNVSEDFIKTVEKNKKYFYKTTNNINLYKKDTLSQISQFKDNHFDLSITSPPYGDNATTVTYGQFSSLALNWIASYDLNLEGWELDNYSIIDRKIIGGTLSKTELNKKQLNLISPYLNQISLHKQSKVIAFFQDYFYFLDELSRVTKKYIAMTLGNRRVDNVKIDLTQITSYYLEHLGFKKISKISRTIQQKRIPRITSSVNKKSVQSMNKEYIIVHEKS